MKSEIRMPKSESNPKREIRSAQLKLNAFVSTIWHSDFGLLSAFGFRHLDFQI